MDDIAPYREAVQAYRIEHGLSMRAMGKLLGVSDVTVCRWLNGQGVGIRHLPAIRRVCHVFMPSALTSPALSSQDDWDTAKPPVSLPIPNTPKLRHRLLAGMAAREWSFPQLSRSAACDGPDTLRRLLIDGELDFDPPVLSALARALAIAVDDLPIKDCHRQLLREAGSPPGYPHASDIPIIGAAQATDLRVIDDELVLPHWENVATAPVPSDGRRYHAFRVEGDSMTPTLPDGITLYADLDVKPVPNTIAVVLTHTSELLIKRWKPINGQILLASDNPEGLCHLLDADQIAWARKVVRYTGEL